MQRVTDPSALRAHDTLFVHRSPDNQYIDSIVITKVDDKNVYYTQGDTKRYVTFYQLGLTPNSNGDFAPIFTYLLSAEEVRWLVPAQRPSIDIGELGFFARLVKLFSKR